MSRTARYVVLFILVCALGFVGYELGGRWWAQRQVNEKVFPGLSAELRANLPADVRQQMVARLFPRCDGDEATMRLFLRAGYSPAAKGEKGITLLHCAAGKGNQDLVNELIKGGADINAQTDEDKFSPIHFAAATHHFDVVKLLVNNGATIDASSPHGTPMMLALVPYFQASMRGEAWPHIASQSGYKYGDAAEIKTSLTDTVDFFLGLGAKAQALGPDGNTLIHYAAAQGDVALLDRLVQKKGLDPKALNARKETALLFALRNGWDQNAKPSDRKLLLANVEWLISKGVDVNARDQNGETVALYVVRSDDMLALMPNLDLYIAGDKGNSIWTVLGTESMRFAQKQPQIRPPLMRDGRTGSGPLHVTAKEAQLDQTMYFIQRGVDVNQTDHEGMTPLHIALQASGGASSGKASTDEDNRLAIVKALLAAGADPNARSTSGLTPLMVADRKPVAFVQTLIDAKADVNAVAMQNGKPVSAIDLHYRALNTPGIDALMRAGARKAN